jgi:hypothetical protein
MVHQVFQEDLVEDDASEAAVHGLEHWLDQFQDVPRLRRRIAVPTVPPFGPIASVPEASMKPAASVPGL